MNNHIGHMWTLSSSSDVLALNVVDGMGRHAGAGAHYSRRTPGSRTFTGVGREVVLVSKGLDAVWACVEQRTPKPRGSGSSRGRSTGAIYTPTVWRNMMFRNLGRTLSSDLIKSATHLTYFYWRQRYGDLPACRLRTEINIKKVKSSNPGYCYSCAGWGDAVIRRGLLFLYAPGEGK